MTRIWKYELSMVDCRIPITGKCKPLCVALQEGKPLVWMEIKADTTEEVWKFDLVPTGITFSSNPKAKYLGTLHGLGGWMVFHVYAYKL